MAEQSDATLLSADYCWFQKCHFQSFRSTFKFKKTDGCVGEGVQVDTELQAGAHESTQRAVHNTACV